MDKAVFIKELRDIFADLNKKDKRYSKVWLGDEDFGGLYYSGKYVLYLKAEHKLGRYKSEVSYLLDLLDKKLGKEKAAYISSLKVYDENEQVHIDRDDITLYNDEVSYNAA